MLVTNGLISIILNLNYPLELAKCLCMKVESYVYTLPQLWLPVLPPAYYITHHCLAELHSTMLFFPGRSYFWVLSMQCACSPSAIMLPLKKVAAVFFVCAWLLALHCTHCLTTVWHWQSKDAKRKSNDWVVCETRPMNSDRRRITWHRR